MRLLPILLFCIGWVTADEIANDVVQDYAQVKELLREFYRRSARATGHDYNPAEIRKVAAKLGNDGTEASANREIWEEVFENDIILNVQQAEALLGEKSSFSRGKRQAQPGEYYYWKDLTIPYQFSVFDASWQNLIRSALRHIEQNTCFRFQENGSARDGLRYFRGSGCWSNVGRQGGRQSVSIGYGCENLGIVAHETLHALGLWHEQSRNDRDDYVRMSFNWIIRGTEGNFEKRTPTNSENLGQPYDMGSVMHYGPKSFTTNWDYNTIVTKDPNFQQTIGQREGISFKDAKMINLRYCMNVCPRQLPCVNDGYTDPNNCGQCKCPRGYGGQLCDQVERTSCGQELVASGQWQQLKSNYVYANDNCAWRIKSPAGQKVEITFDTVSFPCTDSCTSYVEVKSAKTKTATGAHLCCNVPSRSIISEGDDIVLVMRGATNLNPGYHGFGIRYRTSGSPTVVVPTTQPTTRSTTTQTTTLRTTTTAQRTTAQPTGSATGSWGEWGGWGSCTKPCGGCGTRQRVRGCYGGNGVCDGYSVQTQYCNQQVCKGNTGTCRGRLLMPCDLVQKLEFGQKRSAMSPCRWNDEIKRDVGNSLHGSEFYRNPVSRNIIRRRSKRQSSGAMCEKTFTYSCPTDLLTINIDWKSANSPPSDPKKRSANDVLNMDSFYDDVTACCAGYYASGGMCYKY